MGLLFKRNHLDTSEVVGEAYENPPHYHGP